MKSEHTKFGDLSRDEKIELIAAMVDGKTIEKLSEGGKWYAIKMPLWDTESFYRIQPVKPISPSIDWDAVDSRIQYIVNTEYRNGSSGRGHPMGIGGLGTDKRPTYVDGMWRHDPQSTGWYIIDILTSWNPGKCEIKDSLVERPRK